ncbi:MAG: hypothetical protein QFB86_01760 [Patescibacteria group bacterium]|nr:hypothetical protein [Patescibacteria group bacterium]
MKKQFTTLLMLAGFTVVIAAPKLASATTQAPAAALNNAIATRCEASKKSLAAVANIITLDQNSYYKDVSPESLKLYYPEKPAVFLDGTTHNVYSSTGNVPHYDNKGKVVTTGAPRTNYKLVVNSNRGTLASAKALGKGIETSPAYTSFSQALDKVEGDVTMASAQDDTLIAKWNTLTSPAAMAAMDCSASAGRDAVLKLRVERSTDLKALNSSVNTVKNDTHKLVIAQKRLAATYHKLEAKKS